MLFCPLRGRGGSVVGLLIVARGRGASPFSAEDVIAAEMATSYAGLSLYWCQGLGTLHHQLTKNVKKIEQLENAVKKMEKSSGAAKSGRR